MFNGSETAEMKKSEARRAVRMRAAKVRAEREAAEQRAREEAARLRQAHDQANEDDLVEFVQLESERSEAKERYEETIARCDAGMNAVAARMFDRERNRAVVAELLNVSPARVTTMRKSHEAALAISAHASQSTTATTGGPDDFDEEHRDGVVEVQEGGSST